ncbi:50S ribosomal protein L11 methyltransferase [Streptomyces cinnamoneus]|uniref:50S ribosomal protein L11 methyltransferase n=1 Tax=Streptomyces cinnamoneus TaxID=53446 RepID=UPI0034444CF1
MFHPRAFLTSRCFTEFIDGLELCAQRVADVGRGTGILALAAARAGAKKVIASDINPHAARAAAHNAAAKGVGARIAAVCADLLSGLAPRPQFDVIVSNPPYFPGEPLDLADRGVARRAPATGTSPRLLGQARKRLTDDGRLYALFSTHADLAHLGVLIEEAGFRRDLRHLPAGPHLNPWKARSSRGRACVPLPRPPVRRRAS